MERTFRIDEELPAGRKPDWVIGASATGAEKTLMYGTAIVGAALVWVFLIRPLGSEWSWWQQVIAVVIALDLFGGVAANASSSTKQQYQAPLPADAKPFIRLVHNPVTFTAMHVYPLIVVVLYAPSGWLWGVGWYVGTLAAVILVVRVVPPSLERPTALALFVLAVPIALAAPGPDGWQWLPYIFVAKLVLAHAVHEAPYRP